MGFGKWFAIAVATLTIEQPVRAAERWAHATNINRHQARKAIPLLVRHLRSMGVLRGKADEITSFASIQEHYPESEGKLDGVNCSYNFWGRTDHSYLSRGRLGIYFADEKKTLEAYVYDQIAPPHDEPELVNRAVDEINKMFMRMDFEFRVLPPAK